MTASRLLRAGIAAAIGAVMLTGCGFDPYALPLPGGADLGDDPYTVKVHFRDVLDLVPQSSVRVDDISVGKVRRIELDGWNALVTLEINKKAKLPDNTFASIRQTSLLGEKFVSLDPPEGDGTGQLGEGDVIGLDSSGRNPEIEEVLGAASLLFNGGGIEKTKTIVKELGTTLEGREPQIKELLDQTNDFIGQLDDNKDAIIASLEQVNRLAISVNKEKAAITGALDELPEALTVVNEQRDDLVKLLQALDRLGEVGTRVIGESKDDLIKDLQLLEPTIRQLTAAGDNLPETLSTLLTFPFTDGVVGGGNNGSIQEAKAFTMGEYGNLSIHLELSLKTLTQFLGLAEVLDKIPGLDGLLGGLTGSTATDAAPMSAEDLVGLVTGLVPSTASDNPLSGNLPDITPTPAKPETNSQDTPAVPAPSKQSEPGSLPKICTLLGSCRAAATTMDEAMGSDVGKMMVSAVVTK